MFLFGLASRLPRPELHEAVLNFGVTYAYLVFASRIVHTARNARASRASSVVILNAVYRRLKAANTVIIELDKVSRQATTI